jgi:hypothetical protein
MSSTDSPNGRYSTFEYRAGVELGPRLRRAHRHVLALEIGQRLDARVRPGDDLDVVRVDRGDAAELLERRLESRLFVAFPGIRERIAERECNFAASGLQQVQVLDRRLGRLDRRLERRHRLADDVRKCYAQRVVDAACSTRQHIDERLGGGREWRSDGSRGHEQAAEGLTCRYHASS